MGTGGGVNRISSPFPPVSELGSGACEEFGGGAVNEPHPGILPPAAAFALAADAPVDISSERGAKSEHTGTGFTRNKTDPSTQHLDNGGNEEHLSHMDPFVYDLYQGPLDLGGWSCTDDDIDEYLELLQRSAGGPPVGDAGIDTGSDYHVWLRRGGFAVGSSISDNQTISRQSNGCDFFPQ